MGKILFVHNMLRSFVRIDRDLLSEDHDVVEVNFRWKADSIAHVLQVLPSCDMVFIWFASKHAFLPTMLGKLLKKKIIVCSADYDLANEPMWNYGSMRGGLPKLVNNWIFRLADYILVPSSFSRQLALKNTVLKNYTHKIKVIPLGIDLQAPPKVPKEQRVVTVGSIQHEMTIWRKGLKVFVDMAPYIPEVDCVLIGSTGGAGQALQKNAARNVTFVGSISDIARDTLLARSAIYAQLSYMEGFGLSVIEAMQQNCVPVVTNRGSLPEVVGDCGLYVPYNDPVATAERVREALSRPDLGVMARQRVAELFPLEKRKNLLREVTNI